MLLTLRSTKALTALSTPPWQVCPFRSWRVCSCQGLDCSTTLPTLILGFADLEEQQYYPKSTLAWRILVSSQGAFTKHRTSLYSDFLHAHTAPLSTKSKRFSTDEYATLVQGFVQGFADLHLHLHLSETVFQEPGLRPRANRSSSSSSITPTMSSTPRSSWSGYASFTSLNRRTKLASPVNRSNLVTIDHLPVTQAYDTY